MVTFDFYFVSIYQMTNSNKRYFQENYILFIHGISKGCPLLLLIISIKAI